MRDKKLKQLRESYKAYGDWELLDWFGSSQVNLKKDRPMKVYRGISSSKESRHPSSKLGIFFTSNLETAKAYSGSSGSSGVVKSAYIKIENPYKMTYDEIQSIESENQSSSIRNKLERIGYDGIFLMPMEGSGSHPNYVSEYIVFSEDNVWIIKGGSNG